MTDAGGRRVRSMQKNSASKNTYTVFNLKTTIKLRFRTESHLRMVLVSVRYNITKKVPRRLMSGLTVCYAPLERHSKCTLLTKCIILRLSDDLL